MYELYLEKSWQPCPDREAAAKAVRAYITAHDMGSNEWYRRGEGALRMMGAAFPVAMIHYNGKLEYR